MDLPLIIILVQSTRPGQAPLIHGLQGQLQLVGLLVKVAVHGEDHRQIFAVAEADLIAGGQIDKALQASCHHPAPNSLQKGLEPLQLILLLRGHGEHIAHRWVDRVQAQHLGLALDQSGISYLQQLALVVQQPVTAAALHPGYAGALRHLKNQGVRQFSADGHVIHIGQLGQDPVGDLILVQREQVVPFFHAGGRQHLLLGIAGIARYHHGVHPEKDDAAYQNGGKDEQNGQQLIEDAKAPPIPPPSFSVPSCRHCAVLLFFFLHPRTEWLILC